MPKTKAPVATIFPTAVMKWNQTFVVAETVHTFQVQGSKKRATTMQTCRLSHLPWMVYTGIGFM
jgi:hypothetical protein